MKPLIAINVDVTAGPPKRSAVQAPYYEAVIQSGGIPVLLPPMPAVLADEILDKVSGLILVGGDDYSPECYGEGPCGVGDTVHADRQNFDLLLIKLALAKKHLPILGICAGCQLLNIGLGGTLIQDIPTSFPGSPIQHGSVEGWQRGFHQHEVFLEPNSKLFSIYERKQLAVPTSHHQAVSIAGKGLIATSRTEDGVIESIELPGDRFIIGVQWHPERDYLNNKVVFDALIEQASRVASCVS